MKLNRRQFLQLAAGLPFLTLPQFAPPIPPAPPPQTVAPVAQPWQFPLQLPAYFVKVSPRDKVYRALGPAIMG